MMMMMMMTMMMTNTICDYDEFCKAIIEFIWKKTVIPMLIRALIFICKRLNLSYR